MNYEIYVRNALSYKQNTLLRVTLISVLVSHLTSIWEADIHKAERAGPSVRASCEADKSGGRMVTGAGVLFIWKSEVFLQSTSPYTSCQTASYGLSNCKGYWEQGNRIFMPGLALNQL